MEIGFDPYKPSKIIYRSNCGFHGLIPTQVSVSKKRGLGYGLLYTHNLQLQRTKTNLPIFLVPLIVFFVFYKYLTFNGYKGSMLAKQKIRKM